MVACLLIALFIVGSQAKRIAYFSERKTEDMKESGGILEEIFYSVKTVYYLNARQ